MMKVLRGLTIKKNRKSSGDVVGGSLIGRKILRKGIFVGFSPSFWVSIGKSKPRVHKDFEKHKKYLFTVPITSYMGYAGGLE